jgi:hypothetical protein
MDQVQTNRVTMFKTVDAYVESQESVWSGMAPLAAATTAFRDAIQNIDAAAQQQGTPSGATDAKAAARDALEDVVFLTCEALGVLAHTSNDHNLLALTDVTPSGLAHLNAEELVNRATTVVHEAGLRSEELATLHVTQQNLLELEQALRTFVETKEKPRTATAERMAQTESLSNRIREANDILRNRMDRMVNLFGRSNPDFVSGYRGARVVVDRVASHSSAKPPVSPPPPHP